MSPAATLATAFPPVTDEAPRRLQLGALTLDLDHRELRDGDGRLVELRRQALEVLLALGERVGHVVSKTELLDKVWPGVVVTEDSLVQAVSDLRRALGDKGARQLKTVARRGYMLVAEAVAAATAVGAPRPPAHRRLAVLGAAALLLALLVAAWMAVVQPGGASAAARGVAPAIAVLSYRVEPGTDPLLGQGLAEDLIATLAGETGLPVVSGRSSFLPELQKLSTAEAATRLAVRYLVDGTVRRDGDTLLIRTQLIDGPAGRVLWTHDDRAGAAQLAAVRRGLAARLASSLSATVAWQEKRRVLAQAPASLDAYTLAMRAYADKHMFAAGPYRAGRADAEEAIRQQPNYAFAWAALGYLNTADALSRITGEWGPARLTEALQQIDHAIQLDPALGRAHEARAWALSGLGRAAEAMTAAEEAVRLAPGDADSLASLAALLARAGRVEEAVAAMDRALPLYPIRPVYVASFDAVVRWAARQYDAALGSGTYCLDRAPAYVVCRFTRAVTLVEMGRLDEARADAEKIRALLPGTTRSRFRLGFTGELAARRLRAAEQLGFPDDPR